MRRDASRSRRTVRWSGSGRGAAHARRGTGGLQRFDRNRCQRPGSKPDQNVSARAADGLGLGGRGAKKDLNVLRAVGKHQLTEPPKGGTSLLRPVGEFPRSDSRCRGRPALLPTSSGFLLALEQVLRYRLQSIMWKSELSLTRAEERNTRKQRKGCPAVGGKLRKDARFS